MHISIETDNSIIFGLGLLSGVVGGIIAGVVFAPKSGEETRKDLEKTLDYINSKRKIGEGKKNEKRLFGLLNKYVKLVNNEDIRLETSKDVRNLYLELLEEEIRCSDPNNLPDGKIFRKDRVHILKGGVEIVHDGVYPEKKIIEYMNNLHIYLKI